MINLKVEFTQRTPSPGLVSSDLRISILNSSIVDFSFVNIGNRLVKHPLFS